MPEVRLIDANALKEHLKTLEAKAHNKTYENAMQDMLDVYFPEIIDAQPTIEAEPVNRWIPCCEMLPYIGVDVIVYVRTWREHKVQFGYRYSEKTWSVANIGVPNDEITHWMPLPSTEGLK